MLSQAAAAILRLRPGSAARGLPLRVWGRAARRAAEAEAARLERPPGCGRGGVAASFRPPGRRAVAAARVDRAAFAVRAGPSVVPGAAVLQTRALPPLGRETGPWAQQRPRGPSASGFFAGAGIPRSGEDRQGPKAQAAKAQAAASLRTADARESHSQPAGELLQKNGGGEDDSLKSVLETAAI